MRQTSSPKDASNIFRLALHHHQSGQLTKAEHLYRQILTLHPAHADSIHLLGMIALQTGNHAVAVATIQHAISLNPNEALYHSNLGTALQVQGKQQDAIESLQRAVTIKPDYVDAHNNLANSFLALGRLQEAVQHYERALAINPSHTNACVNLAVAFLEQGKVAEAITHCKRAIELNPNCAEAFSNLGNALLAQKNPTEAVACYRSGLALKPAYVDCYYNLGNTLQELDKPAEAIAEYDRALHHQPDNAQVSYGKALAQLLQGNFAAGWQNFERRWDTPAHTPRRNYSQPLWTGEKLSSGSLLLWGEQGLGDEIMFAGLIPDVTRADHSCILDCDRRLAPLFARSFPDVQVVSNLLPVQTQHFHVGAHLPTGSLPRLFRSTVTAFSSTKSPYLFADPLECRHYRQKYSGRNRVIGLAWYTTNPKTGPIRNIDLQLLAPLFRRTDISWVSLQYGRQDDLQQQLTAAQAPVLLDPTVDQLLNVDTFASQVAAMDLVITIDNSTAHLAGSLGVPVWVLLPFARDWRWLQSRPDCPWYPSMRLFRQPEPDDWQTPINRIAAELSATHADVI